MEIKILIILSDQQLFELLARLVIKLCPTCVCNVIMCACKSVLLTMTVAYLSSSWSNSHSVLRATSHRLRGICRRSILGGVIHAAFLLYIPHGISRTGIQQKSPFVLSWSVSETPREQDFFEVLYQVSAGRLVEFLACIRGRKSKGFQWHK